jgi:hypothetical protein
LRMLAKCCQGSLFKYSNLGTDELMIRSLLCKRHAGDLYSE